MSVSVRIRLLIMMFLQYLLWGLWMVTTPTWLEKTLKFTGAEIGWVYSAIPIGALLAPLFVGMFADRFFATERILAILHLVGAGILYSVSLQTSSSIMFFVLLGYALCFMPTLALTNSISLRQMNDPASQFPPIRVMGTIGWIVAGNIVGYLYIADPTRSFETLHFFGKPEDTAVNLTNLPLQLAAGVSVVMGLYCLCLPHTPPLETGEVTAWDLFGLDAVALLQGRSFAVFLIGSILVMIPLQFYYTVMNPFLVAAKVENSAAIMTYGQMSEIIFMLLMPFFFVRLGVKWMLLIGIAAWVVRYLLFSFGYQSGTQSLLLLGILLHGICYDFFFVTGQIYVDKKAPPDIRAKAQGFLALTTLGFGAMVGSWVCGITQAYYAVPDPAKDGPTTYWSEFWLVPAIGAGAILVVFAFVFRDEARAESEASSEPTM